MTSADVSLGGHAPTLLQPVGAGMVALEGGMLDLFSVTASPFALGYTGGAIAIPRTPDASEISAAYAAGRFLVAGNSMRPTFLLDDQGTLALPPAPGSAWMSFDTNDMHASCVATGGTVQLSAYGAIGGLITGSYAGVTWTGTACPGTPSGEFSITREADH